MKKNYILKILFFIIFDSNILAMQEKEIFTDIVFNKNIDFIKDIKFSQKDGFKELFLAKLHEFKKYIFKNCIKRLDKEKFDEFYVNRNKVCFNKEKSFCYARNIKVSDNATVYSMGDIHGSLWHLLKNLQYLKSKEIIDDDFNIIKKDVLLLFTGDFIDRGSSSLEVLFLLIILFLKNPDQVILIRGNHETYSVAIRYGFLEETVKRFNDIESLKTFDFGQYDLKQKIYCEKIFEIFQLEQKKFYRSVFFKTIRALKMLPVTAFVYSNTKIVQYAHACPDINYEINFSDNFALIYNGFIQNSYNNFLWYDVWDNYWLSSEPHEKGVDIRDVYIYLIKNNINALVIAHNHKYSQLDKDGIHEFVFENNSKIIRHIQNFNIDPVIGFYSREEQVDGPLRKIMGFDVNKSYYNPSWVIIKFKKLGELDIKQNLMFLNEEYEEAYIKNCIENSDFSDLDDTWAEEEFYTQEESEKEIKEKSDCNIF